MTEASLAVSISRHDYWLLILSTVRYSMGRMTSMPTFCERMIKEQSHALDPAQLLQLAREIGEELTCASGRWKTLGTQVDHNTWSMLALWCVEQANRIQDERNST